MDYFVGYWREIPRPDLVDPKSIIYGYLNRRRNFRYLGERVEQSRALTPIALVDAIRMALRHDATIIVPNYKMILNYHRVSALLIEHQVDIVSVDGVVRGIEQILAQRARLELDAHDRRMRGRANGRKARPGARISDESIQKGNIASSKLAQMQREIAAQYIEDVIKDLPRDTSIRAIARRLNELHVPTLREGGSWHYNSVKKVLDEHYPGWHQKRKKR